MGKTVRVENIVGLSQVAKRLGVDPSLPHRWIERYPDFPASIADVGSQRVYDMSEVERWYDKHDWHQGRKS